MSKTLTLRIDDNLDKKLKEVETGAFEAGVSLRN